MATICLGKLISEQSPMRFDTFMNLALYHPEWGYYAGEPSQVGRAGDFITNVSTGPLFGKLLAHHVAQWHQNNNISGAWRILEPGPNNGQLARDVIDILRREFPNLYRNLNYITIDPLPVPLAWQRQQLADLAPAVQCLESAHELSPLPTFLIANEILDALPCRVFQRTQESWAEILIHSQNSKLVEELLPLEPHQIPHVLKNLPCTTGYRTEYRDNWHSLLDPLLKSFSFGSLLWIDYGFASPEYYHSARTKGTLRTYQKHRAGESPLHSPGECDITAHVDFTSFAHYAANQNCGIKNFEPQEFFLTRIATKLAEQPCFTAAEIRQFQTLIHPAQMGARFNILELDYPCKQHDPRALSRLSLPTHF